MELPKWINVLAVITSIKCALGERSNLTLLVEKNNGYNFTCILEGNALKSALAWIAPFEYSKESVVSHYLPPSNIIHEYGDQSEAKDTWIPPDGWSINQSTDYDFKPLTGYRWESLKTIVVTNETKYITYFQKSTFSITLSFRMQSNATLYLCEDTKRLECFVVSIDPENMTMSNQPSTNNVRLINFDKTRWNDIIIRHTYNSNKTTLKLRFLNNAYNTPFFERNVSLQHLYIHSYDISLWKLHVYRFLSVNKSTGKTQIGPKITVSPVTLCISMNIAVCSTCLMNITIINEKNEQIINQEVFSKKVEHINQSEELGGTISWKEVKVMKENINNASLRIYLSTSNKNDSSESGLWAINNIRFCDPKEIRVSSLHINHSSSPETVACQVLHEAPINISNTLSEPNCKNPKKIGADCNITCVSIFGENKKYCDRNLICSRENIDYNTNCFCAAGYTGVTCENECPKEKWGFKCGKKCENCKNNQCNVNNGTCTEGCNTGFAAPNCTKPKPIADINTVQKTVNTITIEWNEMVSPEKSFSYIIHYKHKKYHYCKDDTRDAKVETVIMTNTRLAVQKLQPFSDYSFEIAAIYNNITGDFTHYIETTSSTGTPGDEELPLNFTVQQNKVHNLPLILLTEPPCTKIKGNLTYNITFECSNDWCKDSMSTEVVFTNDQKAYGPFAQSFPLTAFSNYTAVLVARRIGGYSNPNHMSSQFQTLVDDPPQVRNLTVYSKNESSISLRWRAPYPPYGELHIYQIQWNEKNKLHKSNNSKPCYLWEDYTCADIRNLKENYTYTISVMAKNKGLKTYGKERFEYDIVTRQAEPKPPKSVKVNWEGDVPVLEWDHPFITNGPLVGFYIEISVIDSEYIDHRSLYDVPILRDNQTYYYKMSDLKPSSMYNISVLANNKFKSKPSRNVIVTMPPPAPYWNSIEISCLESICTVNISKPTNISNLSYLFVVVSINELKTMETKQILHNLKDDQQENAWLAAARPLHRNNTDENILVIVGNETTTFSEYGDTTNKLLQNNTNYVITVIVENRYLNKTRYSKQYSSVSMSMERIQRSLEVSSAISAWYFLFLLVLIPVAIGGCIVYKKNGKLYEDSKTLLPNPKLINCFKGNVEENESLPLHNSRVKPPLLPRPKNLDLFYMQENSDASKPLLSQNKNEKGQFTCRVKLEDLEEYVKQSIGTGEESELARQHSLFVRGQTKPWEYGLEKPNKFKNRYNNLIAYDHSRVKLQKMHNDEFSDYINANYVDGYKSPKAYIATQGPKLITIGDFWRMIWQENVNTIVVLANVEEDGKRKMEEYWPKLNNTVEYSSMEIFHKKSEVFSNYVFRTLVITKDNQERTIKQLHFTAWPDHGVPLYPQSLVPFVKKILTVPQDAAPIVIHCSAGVGRTGTIILCDYILRMAAHEKAVDFLATLHEIRENRANLVDNANQYKLAHLVVLEVLFGLDTTIPCDHELEQKVEHLIKNHGLRKQLDYLEETSWQDHIMYSTYKTSINPANYKKNRFSTIIPESYGRIYISRFPIDDEHSDYINAVEVDDFHIANRFIVTQQPLPDTISAFWRMVFEKNVTTIVSLNKIDLRKESSCIFWPVGDEVINLQFATIKCIEKEEYPSYDFIKVLLIHGNEENEYSLNISIINMKRWHCLHLVPESLDSLIAIWEETNRISRGNYPIVITCYDGATACGLFVALSFLIEKIKLEQICDACLAVRTVRHNRKQFVTSVEQLELLYRAAVQYLKGFETYSNFQIVKNDQ